MSREGTTRRGEGFRRLEDGERMDQRTFHSRYLRTTPDFQAELIGGVVHVAPSRVTIQHGRTHSKVAGWLYSYSTFTPGTSAQNRATTILDEESEVQARLRLLILPTHGGQSRVSRDGYTQGAPEFVAEVAVSGESLDLNAKLRDYERAVVREYFVLDLKSRAIHWFTLEAGKFQPLAPDPDGLYRSRVFPGLWLDAAALLADDNRAVLTALQRGLESPEHAEFVAALQRRHDEGVARA